MRAPSFWLNPPSSPGLLSRLLTPLGAIYAQATRLRVRASGYRPALPVICVGNLNVGGTGKTPTCIAIAQILSDQGYRPHIVSRGYGGSLHEVTRVDPQRHIAAQTGDEPLLLAAFAPTWIARDRAAGVRAAEADGATHVILDDGFQNPAVTKDLSIVVVDASVGFGNERVLPAGPLREPVGRGLERADLILAIGEKPALDRFGDTWAHRVPCPIAKARLEVLATGMDWQGLRTVAFAGIGRPERFFDTLRRLGAEVVEAHALDDHQPIAPALFHRLAASAASAGAQLVTTEKDAVRLLPDQRPQVLTLPVRLVFDDPDFLSGKLADLASDPRLRPR